MSDERPIHWPRGGSNSDRIVACPGCVNLAAQYPSEPSGQAAIDGTHTHTLLEYAISFNLHDAGILIGKELTDHEGSFVVDTERADRANVALRYVMNKRRNAPQVQILSERFVDAGRRWGIPGWGGSADIILHDNDQLFEIVDYKDGGKPVKPDSYQMVTYAIGAQNDFPNLAHLPVRATIVQPKVYSEPYTYTYSPEEFAEKMETLRSAMVQSLDPNAPRNPGTHCKWCPGAKIGRCPEYNQRGTVAINEVFASVPVPAIPPTPAEAPEPAGSVHQTSQAVPTVPLMLPEINETASNEQLAQILDAEPMIMGIIKEAKEEALKRAESGQKIPGHKLVRSITRRRWVDNATEILSGMRLKREVYQEWKLKTPKKVIEAIKDLSEPRRKKIESLIIKPEGGLTLVPETDTREGVEVDVGKLFKDVPKQPEGPVQTQFNFMGD